jgi:conserved oligomeric Golgi complex subunit 2
MASNGPPTFSIPCPKGKLPTSSEIISHLSIFRYAFHLEDMKKNAEAMRRLRKGARANFSLFGSSSTSTQDDAARDEERLRAQTILDVERLGKDAESFGVILDEVSMYTTLVSLASTVDAL